MQALLGSPTFSCLLHYGSALKKNTFIIQCTSCIYVNTSCIRSSLRGWRSKGKGKGIKARDLARSNSTFTFPFWRLPRRLHKKQKQEQSYSGASSLVQLYSRDPSTQGTQNVVPEKCSNNFCICYIYWRNTSIQRTQNLLPQKCSHNLCFVTSIEGTPLFRDRKFGSTKIYVHVIFVSVTSIEGTPLFRGKGHFFWVPKFGLNILPVDTLALKSDWPQKGMLTLLVSIHNVTKTVTEYFSILNILHWMSFWKSNMCIHKNKRHLMLTTALFSTTLTRMNMFHLLITRLLATFLGIHDNKQASKVPIAFQARKAVLCLLCLHSSSKFQ